VHPVNKPFSRFRTRNGVFRFVATAGLLAGLFAEGDVRATPATFTFPAPNPGFVAARNAGLPIIDAEGDAAAARDIVGDAAHPALYIASDATHLYFRLRLDVDPRQNPTNIGPSGWGCLVNTDSDPTTYEYSTIVDGAANPDTIYFYKNTVTAAPNSTADTPDLPAVMTLGAPLTTAVGHAQVGAINPGSFGDNGNVDNDWFMDWAIELAPLVLAGFNPANPASYYCGSANNGTIIGSDCTGTSPGGSGCGPLATSFSDPMTCGPLGCSICGDGTVGPTEACDDGNRVNGDGCDSVCLKELGQSCAGNNSACASGFCDSTSNNCACDTNVDCPAGQLCSTTPNPNICVPPGCGNAILEAGEGCEDGNTVDGDGCNAACRREFGQACVTNSVCASGFCDKDANICACDQDADCSMPSLCNLLATPNACVAPGCGNGVIEINEGCDDGNTLPGDGCNTFCYIEILQECTDSNSCASGLCDPQLGQCTCDDDEDCPGGQQCNSALEPNQCVVVGCGNGMLSGSEGCDDGNLNNGDGCNAQCRKELGQTCTSSTVCASGFCDQMICACDANVDCPGTMLCSVQANPNACVNPGCGNRILESGEGCDDGNLTNGDGCNSVCLLEIGEACTHISACASGACDPIDSTCVCDENADCPVGAPTCKLSADPNLCVVAGCGNGVIEVGEGCDDENKVSGDGCNSSCKLEIGQSCPNGSTTCASGFCDPVGSVCACNDNGDCSGGQLCNILANPNQCVLSGCGNGVIEVGEGCDDNNTANDDGCTSGCLLEIGQSCPNGSNVCASTFCDPTDNTCACNQSDDCPGDQVCDTKAMPNACVDPGCGNLVLESPTEGCDDGNTTSGDGCTATCLLELGQTCNGSSTDCDTGFCDQAGNVCACDEDSDCPSDTLCNTGATPNVCVPLGCGNDVLEADEACDDGNMLDGDGCSAACLIELGLPCTMNTSCNTGLCDGTVCACDQDSDCAAGEVCNTNADPNACVMAGCGNGVLEVTEGCDDGNTLPGDGCNATCSKELGEPCLDGTECNSGNCDGTVNECVCDKDSDCPMDQTCDTNANPHACIVPPPPGCQSDADCLGGLFCDEPSRKCVDCTQDNECSEGVCDEASFTCVECTQNSDCKEGVCNATSLTCVECVVDSDCKVGTCTAETNTCKSRGIIIEGGGIFCTTSSVPANNENWPFALLGLAGLGVLRRRRRS
jgi:MYXO-CTERM domain-containing protein